MVGGRLVLAPITGTVKKVDMISRHGIKPEEVTWVSFFFFFFWLRCAAC